MRGLRAYAVVCHAPGGSGTSRSRPDREGASGDVPVLRPCAAVAQTGRPVTHDAVTAASPVNTGSNVTAVSGITATEVAGASVTATAVTAASATTTAVPAATTTTAVPTASAACAASARTSGRTAGASGESRPGDETDEAERRSERDEISTHG
jgi:hypothetical protein